MPRKNLKEYTQMQIKKSVLKKLVHLKIHPRQSYSELIDKLIDEKNEKDKSKK